MAAKKADMQRLIEQRDKLLSEIEALRNKVAGLELAIALLRDEGQVPKATGGKRQTGVKQLILDMLEQVGTTGLNATTAVKMANQRGVTLERGTVSSLLSRLKRDSVIVYDGTVYRLPKFAELKHDEPSSPRVIWDGDMGYGRRPKGAIK